MVNRPCGLLSGTIIIPLQDRLIIKYHVAHFFYNHHYIWSFCDVVLTANVYDDVV